jgi:hypothetical protein
VRSPTKPEVAANQAVPQSPVLALCSWLHALCEVNASDDFNGFNDLNGFNGFNGFNDFNDLNGLNVLNVFFFNLPL